MREHIAADESFKRTDVPAGEAIERFRAEDEDYRANPSRARCRPLNTDIHRCAAKHVPWDWFF